MPLVLEFKDSEYLEIKDNETGEIIEIGVSDKSRNKSIKIAVDCSRRFTIIRKKGRFGSRRQNEVDN